MPKKTFVPNAGATSSAVGNRHAKKKKKQFTEEYRKLRSMVPNVASRQEVSKIEVIEEAVKYIEELHVELLSRLQTKGMVPVDFAWNTKDMTESEIRHIVHQIISFPLLRFERSSRLPSYLKRCTTRPI